jgi:hypothetical protein
MTRFIILGAEIYSERPRFSSLFHLRVHTSVFSVRALVAWDSWRFHELTDETVPHFLYSTW